MVSSIGAIAGCWAPKVPRRRRRRVWCRSSVFRAGTACERMPPRYRRGSPMSEISGAARRWGRASGVRARQFVGRARDRRSERCIAGAHVPIWVAIVIAGRSSLARDRTMSSLSAAGVQDPLYCRRTRAVI